jgi:hypothetical protein
MSRPVRSVYLSNVAYIERGSHGKTATTRASMHACATCGHVFSLGADRTTTTQSRRTHCSDQTTCSCQPSRGLSRYADSHGDAGADWRNGRAGPGCLNSFSASISGASAGVRLPCGGAAGGSRRDRVWCRQGSSAAGGDCRSRGSTQSMRAPRTRCRRL